MDSDLDKAIGAIIKGLIRETARISATEERFDLIDERLDVLTGLVERLTVAMKGPGSHDATD